MRQANGSPRLARDLATTLESEEGDIVPVLYEGKVYFSNHRKMEDYVFCLDAKDGSLVWRSEPVRSAVNVVTVGEDFVKIQFEYGFPPRPEIQTPDDWTKMPVYGREYFEEQLGVVEGLVRAAKGEALVLQTLYSPFMSAGHTLGGGEAFAGHIKTAPDKTTIGMEAITESILWFVRECIQLGIDGF